MSVFVYLETAPNSGVMKFRGEVGPHDNPDGFAIQMEKSGLRTHFSPEFRGERFHTDVRGEN